MKTAEIRPSEEEKDCIFCKLAKDEKVVVWENSLFYVSFDPHPVSPGHALIIPKRHVVEISDLNEKEWGELREAIQSVVSLIEKTDFRKLYQSIMENPVSDQTVWFCQKALSHPRINTKPDAYNHGVNDGKAAGRTENHLHWHIIPRYEGDMKDPRGGVRYVIPGMGNYKIKKE